MLRRVECARKTTSGARVTLRCVDLRLIVIGDVSKCLRSNDFFFDVDLKAIPPKREPRADEWVMLVAVDFAPGEVFARAIDCGKVTVQEAQSRFAEDFMTNSDPPVILWSDAGGQFKTESEHLFQELLFCKRTFISPGNAVSTGYMEVLNRVLPAMHGGDRRYPRGASLAYNARAKTPKKRFLVCLESPYILDSGDTYVRNKRIGVKNENEGQGASQGEAWCLLDEGVGFLGRALSFIFVPTGFLFSFRLRRVRICGRAAPRVRFLRIAVCGPMRFAAPRGGGCCRFN